MPTIGGIVSSFIQFELAGADAIFTTITFRISPARDREEEVAVVTRRYYPKSERLLQNKGSKVRCYGMILGGCLPLCTLAFS